MPSEAIPVRLDCWEPTEQYKFIAVLKTVEWMNWPLNENIQQMPHILITFKWTGEKRSSQPNRRMGINALKRIEKRLTTISFLLLLLVQIHMDFFAFESIKLAPDNSCLLHHVSIDVNCFSMLFYPKFKPHTIRTHRHTFVITSLFLSLPSSSLSPSSLFSVFIIVLVLGLSHCFIILNLFSVQCEKVNCSTWVTYEWANNELLWQKVRAFFRLSFSTFQDNLLRFRSSRSIHRRKIFQSLFILRLLWILAISFDSVFQRSAWVVDGWFRWSK